MRVADEVIVNTVVHMAERLIEREYAPNGYQFEKIAGVASKIGESPATVRNLVKGRLKFVERIEKRIRQAFIKMLETEIAKATHDLQIARQISDRMDASAVLAAEAAVLAAQKTVRELMQ